MNNINTDDTKNHGGGPKTTEGKRRSSLNAMRHGFTGNTIVLPTEVRAEFDELLDDYIHDYIHDFSPETRFELDLVHELAATRWRLQRLWGMESTLLHLGMHRSEQAARVEFASALADNLVTTLAFIEMSGVTRSMQLLNRYESRLTKRFREIQTELRAIAKERTNVAQASSLRIFRPVFSFLIVSFAPRHSQPRQQRTKKVCQPNSLNPVPYGQSRTQSSTKLLRTPLKIDPNGRTPPDRYVNRAPESPHHPLRARPVCLLERRVVR